MNHPEEGLIHDFVDDELTGEERGRIAAHLAECVSCRAVASSARSLRDEAVRTFGAKADRTDAPNQWVAIEARIGGESSATRSRRSITPWRAAAAVILLAITSGAIWASLRPRQEVAVAPALASGAVPVGLADGSPAATIDGAYAPAFTELEKMLADEHDRLQPETIATVEANIAILNKAIAEIQAALAADPANRDGLKALDGMYQAKLGVLKSAATLAPEA